jgi:hypothetical protein
VVGIFGIMDEDVFPAGGFVVVRAFDMIIYEYGYISYSYFIALNITYSHKRIHPRR